MAHRQNQVISNGTVHRELGNIKTWMMFGNTVAGTAFGKEKKKPMLHFRTK